MSRPRSRSSTESSKLIGSEPIRLQKFLSRAGIASRRAAERMITAGRVRVNGETTTVLGSRVRPDRDRVEVDGRPVAMPEVLWLVLHKPVGYLTTASDPRGRPTVFDLLPPAAVSKGLSYVGRLDLNTSGLLLFGNDGDAMHALAHPGGGVEREYRVGVAGRVSESVLERLTRGVELEDGLAVALRAEVVQDEPDGSVLSLVLSEGRKREVRRMCAAVGHDVRWLARVRFGPVELGDLAVGEARPLSRAERARLEETVRSVAATRSS